MTDTDPREEDRQPAHAARPASAAATMEVCARAQGVQRRRDAAARAAEIAARRVAEAAAAGAARLRESVSLEEWKALDGAAGRC